jgi:hypothetical protein
VLRRLALSLVLWVGVLGVASPALACAATAALERDCCPEGMPSPCEGGSGDPSATLCCVAAPAPAQAVAAESGRTQLERAHDSGSPDPFIVSAWLATFVRDGSLPARISSSSSAYRTDATLTYLLTRRLRL